MAHGPDGLVVEAEGSQQRAEVGPQACLGGPQGPFVTEWWREESGSTCAWLADTAFDGYERADRRHGG
jgi:hypothetical protein